MVLIGFLGKKRSGKDTCADYLVEYHNFEKTAFAKPLKDCLKVLFHFTDEQLYGDKKEDIDERWNTSPRKAMQFIGTDVIRNQFDNLIPNIGLNFWTKHFEIFYNDNKNKNIVVSDVRFQNEVNTIKKLGGIIIKIQRDSNNINSKCKNDTHESEIEMNNIENYDILIQNNSSFEELYKQIEKTINNVFCLYYNL